VVHQPEVDDVHSQLGIEHALESRPDPLRVDFHGRHSFTGTKVAGDPAEGTAGRRALRPGHPARDDSICPRGYNGRIGEGIAMKQTYTISEKLQQLFVIFVPIFVTQPRWPASRCSMR